MNIIFYRYDSICEPHYIDAFKALGINVIEDDQGIGDKLSVQEKMTQLGEMIAIHKPMFVFSINFFPFVSMICDRLKVKYVTVVVDCPVFQIFNNAIKSEYNRMFLFDKSQYEAIASQNPKGIFYLPLGSPVEGMDSIIGDVRNYTYEVSFVGSLYNEKNPFTQLSLPKETEKILGVIIKEQSETSLSGLDIVEEKITDDMVKDIKKAAEDFYDSSLSIYDLDRYVAIHGYISSQITCLDRMKMLKVLSENFEPGQINLFTQSDVTGIPSGIINHGPADSFRKMPFVFRQSRININLNMRSLGHGIIQRVWDVLACGGFLITNYQDELTQYLEPGTHLVTYDSWDELVEKTRYYLAHDEEREAITRNGYNVAAQQNRVFHRVMSIIRAISE